MAKLSFHCQCYKPGQLGPNCERMGQDKKYGTSAERYFQISKINNHAYEIDFIHSAQKQDSNFVKLCQFTR